MLPRRHPVSKYGKESHMDEESCRLKARSSRVSHGYRDIKGAFFRAEFGRLRRRQSGAELRTRWPSCLMKISSLAIEVNEYTGKARVLNHTRRNISNSEMVQGRSLELRDESLHMLGRRRLWKAQSSESASRALSQPVHHNGEHEHETKQPRQHRRCCLRPFW